MSETTSDPYETRLNIHWQQGEVKIFSADIIYVGGGNTVYMMRVWRRLGVDKLLRTAYQDGIVLAFSSSRVSLKAAAILKPALPGDVPVVGDWNGSGTSKSTGWHFQN